MYQSDPASSSSAPASSSSIPSVVLFYACPQASLDATTGACSNPIWVQQPQLFPTLAAAGGVTIGVAILTCWATAAGYRALQRVGD